MNTNKLIPITSDCWCDPECPFFQFPTDQVKLDGRCKKLDKELDYYDWFLAACIEENE